MTEENTGAETPEAETDITKEWRATQDQKASATRLRIFAAIAWVIAIGGEIAGADVPDVRSMCQGSRPCSTAELQYFCIGREKTARDLKLFLVGSLVGHRLPGITRSNSIPES